jgi:CheY-like chemotaxis protein
VTDTGHGMDPATLARIFEPFFTTKPVGEGTGLGLAAVHGIMQSHEGVVTVESQLGAGTAFRLYFPAHASEMEGDSAPEGAIPRGHGERILYLDDEAPLARLGQKILERLGYAVDVHTVPAQALEAVRRDPGRYRLMITDQMMPGMTGTELVQRVRLIRPDLPVILTTGYTATLTDEVIRRLGINQLLPKPLSIELLGVAVDRVLRETV